MNVARDNCGAPHYKCGEASWRNGVFCGATHMRHFSTRTCLGARHNYVSSGAEAEGWLYDTSGIIIGK